MRRRRSLSEQELELWRRLTADVTPKRGAEPVKDDPAVVKEAAGDEAGDAEPSSETWLSRETPKVRRTDLQPGSMDRRTLQRLRKGRAGIEGRIDLHGLTQEEAHERLCAFIEHSQRMGRRMVLVITGRGARDDGILKRMTPRWLKSAPISRHVLAISSAHAMHGGMGALYVQLRRPHR